MKEKILGSGRWACGVCVLGAAVLMAVGCDRTPEATVVPPELKAEAVPQVQGVREIMSLKDDELLEELFGELLLAGENPRIVAKSLDFKALGPRWSEGDPERKFLPGLWFRQDIVVGNDRYHVAFFELQEIDPKDGKPVSAHESSVAVTALTYKYRADTGVWEVLSRQHKPFVDVGSSGQAFVAEADIIAQVMLSPTTSALMTPSFYRGQEYSTYGIDILAFDGKSWSDLGNVTTREDNSETCDARRDQVAAGEEFKPCWGYFGDVAVFPFVEGDYASLLIKVKGNHAGPDGALLPAEDQFYSFDQGHYRKVDQAAN